VEIRLKNGMPLMTAGGLIAGSQACCCENPPPPVCVCADLCSYFIEVLTPVGVAVKSPAVDCTQSGPFTAEAIVPGWIFAQAEPPASLGLSLGSPIPGSTANYETSASAYNNVASNFSGGLGAFVASVVDYTDGDDFDPSVVRVTVSADAYMYCDVTISGQFANSPALVARIAVYIAEWRNGQWETSETSAYTNIKIVSTRPATEGCVHNYDRSCTDDSLTPRPPPNLIYMETPLTLTVDGGTSSIGAWQQFSAGGRGPKAAAFEEWANDILDAASATFRITSRPNCDSPIACECGPYLDGLLLQFEGVGYWIGTEVETWTDFSGEGEARRAYGTQASWTVVHDKTDGFNLAIFNRRQLDIYCETTVDGPVWRALIRTYCYEDGAIGEDVWMGRFDCYKTVCEDLEKNRPLDQPIPQEEPVEVEYLGRTYFGATDCTPPPRPFVRLEQVSSC
jgi:hypothetical protein